MKCDVDIYEPFYSNGKGACRIHDPSVQSIMKRDVDIHVAPSSFGKVASGSHETTAQSIMKCDVDVRRNLHANSERTT